MKVALVSLNSVWEDKRTNLIEVEKYIKNIGNDAEYVIFPEMTLTGFSVNNQGLAEDLYNSESLKHIQELADTYNINIIFGMLIAKGKNIFNSCVAINKNGNVEGSYHKIHLFSFGGEDKLFKSGSKMISLPWDGGWGLSICYDLRFPELFQKLSTRNLILLNIANWPKERISHWKILLCARAIETQSYMIGVNRIGIDGNDLEYIESSSIFSPFGIELIPIKKNEELKIYELNLEEAMSFRSTFPIVNDRRIIK